MFGQSRDAGNEENKSSGTSLGKSKLMNPNEKPKIEGEPESKPEEESKKDEKFTSIVRVLGRKYEDISEEERQKFFETMEKRFRNQEEFKKDLLKDFGSKENIPDFIRVIFFEREKTPEELEIINLVNQKTNELRRKFSLPNLNIPLENIYVVNNNDWPKEVSADSYYVPIGQFIVIREPKIKHLRSSKTIFAKNLIHEIVHFKSYNSLKKLEDFSDFNVYKTGLKNFTRSDSDKLLFGNLDEAVVEELTIKLLKSLRSHPLFEKEFERTEEAVKILSDETNTEGKPLLNGDEFYIGFDQENDEIHSADFRRVQERNILNKLIEKIYTSDKNASKFKSREEVFDMFVEAVMTGRIVHLGKLIDKTFGKGTFRKIAETDSDINKLEKYVDSLE